MIPFTESLRYDYPSLGKDSIVIDAGAYEGNWAKHMHAKYGCIVLAFEPVAQFFAKASETCAHTDRITLFNCGLGDRFHQPEFGVQNDSSGIFAGSPLKEKVIIMEAVPHLRQIHKGHFDLIKINIEGGEYALLEHFIKEDFLTAFDNLQAQFHTCAPDWENRYAAIATALSRSHELTWREPFVWENWRKR